MVTWLFVALEGRYLHHGDINHLIVEIRYQPHHRDLIFLLFEHREVHQPPKVFHILNNEYY
jgi:hypothetical protein